MLRALVTSLLLASAALADPVDWVTTDGVLVVFGTEGEIRIARAEEPSAVSRRLPAPFPVAGLQIAGGRIFAEATDGRGFTIEMTGLEAGDGWIETTETWPLRPHRFDRAEVGRLVFVARGADGLETRRTAGLPELFMVTVGDNFFQPKTLTIDPGDFVRWTNLAAQHNVRSCEPELFGCDGAGSTDAFTSGVPQAGPWIYDRAFPTVGVNRYLCETHPAQMKGVVVVGDADGPPPAVSDTVTVARLDAAGSALRLEWDAPCEAVEYRLLASAGSRLPSEPGGTYQIQSAVCSVGFGPPYVWGGVPDPAGDSTRLLWWLVVATDGDGTEGPFGPDSFGDERTGAGPGGSSGRCDSPGKDLSGRCAR